MKTQKVKDLKDIKQVFVDKDTEVFTMLPEAKTYQIIQWDKDDKVIFRFYTVVDKK